MHQICIKQFFMYIHKLIKKDDSPREIYILYPTGNLSLLRPIAKATR